jgi:hypothetical protein
MIVIPNDTDDLSDEDRAKLIAQYANQCCHRSDGYEDDVYKLALRMIREAQEPYRWRDGLS